MRYYVVIACMVTVLSLSACGKKEPIKPVEPPTPPIQPADNDDTYVPMNYYY